MWGEGRSAAAIATLVLALSGCSLSLSGNQPAGSTPSPLAATRAAVTRLSSTSANTFHVSGTVSEGSLGDARIAGVVQVRPTPAADLRFELSNHLPGALSAASTEVILKDGIEYLTAGGLGLGGVPARTRPWVKFDYKTAGSLPGVINGLSSLGTVSLTIDPAAQVSVLLAASHLNRVGTDTVDGVRSIHYSGTVDVATLVRQEAGSALTSDQLQRIQAALQQGGITTEHVDVWLSSSDLPVELKTVTTSTALGETTADIHYSDWGAPVTITNPPADKVTDLSGLPHS